MDALKRQENDMKRPFIDRCVAEENMHMNDEDDDILRQTVASTTHCPSTSTSSLFEPSASLAASSSHHHQESSGGGRVDRLSQDPSPAFNRNESRLLDRDAAFYQSRGHWGIRRVSQNVRLQTSLLHQCGRTRLRQWWNDWFYSMAYKPTIKIMLILFILYTAQVFFFAFLYFGLSQLPNDGASGTSFCGMDINNRMEALYFSLSTMTTIGYGVSDYYFGDCWTPLLLVLCQSCCAIAFQSVAIGLLFQRISRGQKRGKTIIFSDKAVVRRVRGIPYLMFRLGELRRQHLIDVVVRVYCLKHERMLLSKTGVLPPPTDPVQHHHEINNNNPPIETYHFMTRHIKLLHPDEERIGNHILMSLPQVIVHRMDKLSPLIPRQNVWYDEAGQTHQSDSSSNQQLCRFLRDREVEIIVQVEGTDELTAQPLQARHSYRHDDIVWDHTFVSCTRPFVSEDERGGGRRRCQRRQRGVDDPICTIDFARFHDVVPAGDAEDCPYVTLS